MRESNKEIPFSSPHPVLLSPEKEPVDAFVQKVPNIIAGQGDKYNLTRRERGYEGYLS